MDDFRIIGNKKQTSNVKPKNYTESMAHAFIFYDFNNRHFEYTTVVQQIHIAS